MSSPKSLRSSRPWNRSVADDLRTDGEAAQKQLARLYVVSLLRNGVLRGGVQVAQPPLQR
jgi:hypothetical protein